MPKEPMRLTEMEIETVGLVQSGAVGVDFLLLKNREGGSTMGDVTQPTTETLLEGVLEKLKGVFVSKEEIGQVIQTGTADTATKVADLQKAYEASLEEIKKANEELKKSNEGMQAKLEKAEADAKLEKEEREKREYIEKAAEFRALPVQYNELGAELHSMAKAMPKEEYEWVFALLKAVDNQLGAAGIFNEMGTTSTPEELEAVDKINKAVAEGKDPKEALLSLSKAEQEEVLSRMVYSKRGK